MLKGSRAILLLVLCVGLFTLNAFSQAAAIKTDDGILFVNNSTDKSFTFEITGKKIDALQSEKPMFSVDGKLLQIMIVSVSSFADSKKKQTDEELLEAHKIWESDYLGNEMYGKKLTLETEKITSDGRQLLFWGYARPSYNEQFSHDYFLTTIVGKTLVGFGSPIKASENKADVKSMLLKIAKSLKVSDKPFDIEKLSDEIKKGTIKKPN
jgi:hypothetical protein